MSTRCQVQVIQEGVTWDEKITLYHHTDGYPDYMIPLFGEARALIHPDWQGNPKWAESSEWEKGRAGKAASFLCAVDPGRFEPEEGHDLHGDIEWYYRLYVAGKESRGTLAEVPSWEVEIYKPRKGFWDNPSEENLEIVLPRKPLEAAILPAILQQIAA